MRYWSASPADVPVDDDRPANLAFQGQFGAGIFGELGFLARGGAIRSGSKASNIMAASASSRPACSCVL